MSILIKGMEMPKNCEVCPLNFYECALLEKSSEEIMQYFGGDSRHPDCPLVEAPRWIPVTERLPEEDERVLVVAHRINDNSPVVSIDSVEVDEGKLRFSLYRGVDYWMPLPQPPKEG